MKVKILYFLTDGPPPGLTEELKKKKILEMQSLPPVFCITAVTYSLQSRAENKSLKISSWQ